jgi:hypothetical protein
MKKMFGTATIVVLFAALSTAQMTTDPCVALNLRPCPMWGEFGTDLTFQDVIDDMTLFGTQINAYGAQNRNALFQPRAPGVVTMVFAYDRFFGPGQYFGIYKAGRPARKVMIFEGGQVTHGDVAVLHFRRNGDLYVNGQLAARNFGQCFGLFVDVYGGTPLAGGSGNPNMLDWSYFSEDARNFYGDPQMLAVRGNNKTVFQIPGMDAFLFQGDQYLFGLENLPCTPRLPGAIPADLDYNDAVVLLSNVRSYRPLTLLPN